MLEKLKKIAIEAGKQIMMVYTDDLGIIDFKEDDSPLTEADRLSHLVIKDRLSKNWPDIPILSEEGRSIPYQERASWNEFWLVDPLDGTKEFIKKNGEFTVNIALIRNRKPVLGIIYAPALDILYFAEENEGAYKQIEASKHTKEPVCLEVDCITNQKKVVVSRSHMSKETESFLKNLKLKEGKTALTSIGSSLKFCLIAEGNAQYYPRFAPTMEWDTAAGQVIVEEAGGTVVVKESTTILIYNKEQLTNPDFLCACKRID
jgi:3'(2'), 5'-bisphosphate nucleotidase